MPLLTLKRPIRVFVAPTSAANRVLTINSRSFLVNSYKFREYKFLIAKFHKLRGSDCLEPFEIRLQCTFLKAQSIAGGLLK